MHHWLCQEEKHPNEYFSEIALSFSRLCLISSNITSPFPPHWFPPATFFSLCWSEKPSAWALISLISAPTPLHSHITTQISREQRRCSAALLLFKPPEWLFSIYSEKSGKSESYSAGWSEHQRNGSHLNVDVNNREGDGAAAASVTDASE